MFFSFYNEPYVAVIGDIKCSKKLNNRKEVQERLKNTLERINKTYKKDISSKFLITLGDEFQGLLGKGENVMHIIEEIEREMYPVRIRFGVGAGDITTNIISDMAIGADGPGYYRARYALEYLKQNEHKNMKQVSDIRLDAEGDNESTILMLNTILSLIAVLKQSWTERQREIIWDLMKYRDGQINAARRLGVAQSTVQRALSGGNYYAYREALDTVIHALKEIRREDV